MQKYIDIIIDLKYSFQEKVNQLFILNAHSISERIAFFFSEKCR
jgi:hypothetical protein